MTDNLVVSLPDEQHMVAFGEQLGLHFQAGVLFLQGGLGAGKTTLCRGILRSKGYAGAVKSPTYTLVEPYQLPTQTLFHFDLYRLHDPEELEYMGIRDYFEPANLCLIEWPEMGEGVLPVPDMTVRIELEEQGRKLTIMASTSAGKRALKALGVSNN
jgi:tRNA threonylcarbamoyladenosine biosynthesis protein TsaE